MTYKFSEHNMDVSMFLREIQLGIMPIGSNSTWAPDFAVEIQGDSKHKARVIAILEGPPNIYGNYSWDNLEKLLGDVVEMLIGNLMYYGRSVHKIARIKENGKTYRLHNFLCQHFFRAFGRYIQIIPKEDRDSAYKGYPILPGLWNKAYVIIPKKDVWTIAMPKALGGYRGYRAMLKRLAWHSNIEDAEFFVAKITKQWGWINDGQDNCNEFYYVYRILRLKWAQACLREYIVKELNQLFQRLDIEAEIVVKGLPTAWEILKIRERMCNRKISFTDALDACSV